MSTYTIGLDLGQAQDPSALAVVRRVDQGLSHPVFQVGHLERIPLGTTYPGVVGHTKRLMNRTEFLPRPELVIDYTGVGRPVYDVFLAAGLSPIGVTITGGDSPSREGMIHRVPKIILVSRLQALLHDGRLRIRGDLPEAAALVSELNDFRAEISDSGTFRFGARSGKHDDLVLALAIAVWRSHGDQHNAGMAMFELARQQAAEAGHETEVFEMVKPTFAVGSMEWHNQQALDQIT